MIITILANALCMCIFKNKFVYVRGDIHQLAEENEGGSEVPYENMSNNRCASLLMTLQRRRRKKIQLIWFLYPERILRKNTSI